MGPILVLLIESENDIERNIYFYPSRILIVITDDFNFIIDDKHGGRFFIENMNSMKFINFIQNNDFRFEISGSSLVITGLVLQESGRNLIDVMLRDSAHFAL